MGSQAYARDVCAIVLAEPFELFLRKFADTYLRGLLERVRGLLELASIPPETAKLGWMDPGGMRVVRGAVEMNPLTASGWLVATGESLPNALAALQSLAREHWDVALPLGRSNGSARADCSGAARNSRGAEIVPAVGGCG